MLTSYSYLRNYLDLFAHLDFYESSSWILKCSWNFAFSFISIFWMFFCKIFLIFVTKMINSSSLLFWFVWISNMSYMYDHQNCDHDHNLTNKLSAIRSRCVYLHVIQFGLPSSVPPCASIYSLVKLNEPFHFFYQLLFSECKFTVRKSVCIWHASLQSTCLLLNWCTHLVHNFFVQIDVLWTQNVNEFQLEIGVHDTYFLYISKFFFKEIN